MKTRMPRTTRSVTQLAQLATIAVVLAGCASGLVRGETPYVKIDSLRLDGTTMEIGLGVRNINEVTIEVARVNFTVMLDGSELARFDDAVDVSVTASGRETLRFELQASESGRRLLESLEKGEVPNLPYTLEGTIDAAEEGSLEFTGEGRLYPVPGRPGQFR